MQVVILEQFPRLKELNEMAPEGKKAKIHMLGEFIQGREKIIEDPIFVSYLCINHHMNGCRL